MDNYEQKIADYYDTLKMRALEKFRKGRLEHNEDFSQLDFEREIENELIDIHNYMLMDKWVKQWNLQQSLKSADNVKQHPMTTFIKSFLKRITRW